MILGEEESDLIREVSLFKSAQTWYLGREEVSCLERCPYRGVPLYTCVHVYLHVRTCMYTCSVANSVMYVLHT